MSDEPDEVDIAVTARWAATCKDCRTRRALDGPTTKSKKQKSQGLERESFDYSDEWATRTLERGGSRSDRCPECRRTHAKEIRAFPVAYVDITAIGSARLTDPAKGPSGPLGGLGPLPNSHKRIETPVTLSDFKLGLKRRDILRLLERMASNQVVILEAGTGTGKSTLAPFRLMNPPAGAAHRPTDFGPIIVTEPRIPATTEVAKFVGEAMCFGHDPAECTEHVGPGYPVGYQCDGKKVWDDACRLVYVTDGSMINWIRNGDLARFSTIIIDEAHERSENIDTILTLLHEYLPRFPHLKVVIASATIDRRLFEEYFADVTSVGHYLAEAPKPIGYGVPLFAGPDFPPGGNIDAFLSDGLKIANPSNPDGDPLIQFSGWAAEPTEVTGGRNLWGDTRALLELRWETEIEERRWFREMPEASAEQSFRLMEAVVSGSVPPGDVIAFLPTEGTVQAAKASLERKLVGREWPVAVYWLMKATPDKEKEAALAECDPGSFKVVFASNLAETSLTIAGLRYVVDSGLICQAQWDPHIAASSAPVGVHSQSGVRQRWGRVGRKNHGWVFPLYSIQQFQKMPRDTPAGSTQTSLDQMYMKLAAAGVDDIATVKLPANFKRQEGTLDKFGEESSERFTLECVRAQAALFANGAMTADGLLTPLGRELERSRLSPERTVALLFADRLACVPEVALALVALDAGPLAGRDRLLRDDWKWPAAWCVQANRCHRALALGCRDDLDLVFRIFSGWESALDPGEWAHTWWIDEEALETIRGQVSRLIDEMAPGMSKEASRPLDMRLADRVRAVLSQALASAHYRRRRSDGLYEPVRNPVDREPVSLDVNSLVVPGDLVVALHRERPRQLRGRPAGDLPTIRGIVNVLDWVCQDASDKEGPDPFDLMLRARRELRQPDGGLAELADPLRPLRSSFPVGSMIIARVGRSKPRKRVGFGRIRAAIKAVRGDDDGRHDLRLEAARVTRQPFILPDEVPTRPDDRSRQGNRQPRTARQVYTGSGSPGRETSGDFRRRVDRIAGAEDAPEELALRPQAITDLETERFNSAHVPAEVYRPDSLLNDSDEITTDIGVRAYGPIELPVGPELTCSVVGYTMGAGVGLQLEVLHDSVAERTDPAYHEDFADGDDAEVVAGELVSSTSGSYRVLHRCDADGNPTGLGDFFFHGPPLDENDINAAVSIYEGSTWRAKVMPWGRPSERQSISLIGEMYDSVVNAFGLRDTPGRRQLQARVPVLGSLEGNPVAVDDDLCRVVRLDCSSDLGFRPTFIVPIRPLTADPTVEDSLPPGTPVSIRIGPKLKARRSGRWTTAQLEQLEATVPDLLDVRGDTFNLATNAALDDRGVHALRRLAPQDPSTLSRVWRLWETSRHLGVVDADGPGLVHGSEEIEAARVAHAAKLAANRENIAAKEAIVAEAIGLADSDDWQSAAERLRSLHARWKEIGPLPREANQRLWEEFSSARSRFRERRGTHVFASKKDLIRRAETLEGAEGTPTARDEVRVLMEEWKAVGSAGVDDDELWDRFKEVRDSTFERWRSQAFTRKQDLITRAAALKDSPDYRAATAQQKALSEEWKAAGSAGKDIDDELWNRFSVALDMSLGQWRSQAILIKQDIIARARTLAGATHLRSAFAERKALNDEWKAAGSAGRDDDKLYEQLKAAMDVLQERIDDDRDANRRAKQGLIAEAKRLGGVSDLKSGLANQKELMARWKAVGPAARDVDDQLWVEFSTAREGFFDRIRAEREANRRAKEQIVARAEYICQFSAWKQVSAEFRVLRDQWKNTGPAERDDDARLWARLNAAHDHLKARQNAYFGR